MQYILLSILVFLGLPIGILVGKLAEEELKPGREYLKWLMHGLFVAIIALFLIMNQSLVFFMGIPVMIILFSISADRETLYYYALAPIMLLAYSYNGFVWIAPLIFLYGFPLGSLYFSDNPKKKWKNLVYDIGIKYGGFLLLSLAFEVIIFVR